MEVLSSRLLYRSGDFDSLRRFYEQTVGLHVYREYGTSDETRLFGNERGVGHP
jgi:hypothetical protein